MQTVANAALQYTVLYNATRPLKQTILKESVLSTMSLFLGLHYYLTIVLSEGYHSRNTFLGMVKDSIVVE